MKVLVVGATGGTGRHVVEQGVARGHEVTAFARDPRKVPDGVNAARGDALDYETVERAVAGQEAVICALGAPLTRTGTVRSEGTLNLVRAMEKAGARRLVVMSTIGMGESREMLTFRYKYVLVPLLLRGVFADTERQEEHVRQSDLDWTLVRAGALGRGERTGAYKHGVGVTTILRGKISRADAADFLLKQLQDDAYVRQAPYVSY
ncbi:SDR family oxidoreductase [Spirillospora sp. NPDC047279]|uniref:NAD(P)-dependent oxidoreductase n=1 Tax=Spirillospora sp. NPDC047279 TaxID=3155478 RepID=UPI0033C16329